MDDVNTIEGFKMAVYLILSGFILMMLKKGTDFIGKYTDTWQAIKLRELELSEKKNKAEEVKEAIVDGVAKANQEAKNKAKNPDDENLTEDEMKKIATEHVKSAVNHEITPEILDSRIEAEVYRASMLGASPIIKIDPPADIKITEGQ